jgi:hypothetical protein
VCVCVCVCERRGKYMEQNNNECEICKTPVLTLAQVHVNSIYDLLNYYYYYYYYYYSYYFS